MEKETGMKQPPRGKPINSRVFDNDDSEIMRRLAEQQRCTQRLSTDGGRHYIFCGAYYHGKATKTAKGWRCEYHAP